jgi:tetratricopeptide (TPR) repeat protein
MEREPETRGLGGRGARPLFWVLLAVVVFGVAATASILFVRTRGEARRAKIEQAERARAERAQPAAALALAPLPLVTPLIERPGQDADGYPNSYVDLAALRSLLGRQKYAELNRFGEEFQRAYEADFRTEYYVRAISDAFSSSEPELAPMLDAWVAATPTSFVPYLARGSYRLDRGSTARGTAWSKDTDATNFDVMGQEFELAQNDLNRALELSPRLVAALRQLMRISFIGSSRRGFAALAQRAYTLCPACMQPRIIEQIALEPRWGGSYREMKAAAAAAPVQENSRLRLLPGYAEIDRANAFIRDKQLERALEHAERACALGESVDFLIVKADILRRQAKPVEAIAALRRALTLAPSNALLSLALAEAEADAKDWRAAYKDLSAGLRIDPTSSDGRRLKPYVVKGLVYVGWEAHKQGREGEALDALDEAAELDPNRDVEGRRTAVLTSGFHGKDEEIAALERGVLAAPHDFSLHVRLDYALSTRHDWPRIQAMWTRYLTDNESDARAYRERAGTFARQGRMVEARADARRACELGSSAGCALGRR